MTRWTKIFNSPPAAAVTIVLLVFGLLFPLRNLGNLELLELNAYDFFLGLESKTLTPQPITEILIDETDLQKHGWPITDERLNRILNILLRHDPRAIGIDIYRDLPVPPGHQELSTTLKDNNSIIGTMKFGQSPKERVRPPDYLVGARWWPIARYPRSHRWRCHGGLSEICQVLLPEGWREYPGIRPHC